MRNKEIIQAQETTQAEQQEKKPLTLYLHGGSTLFRAHCPELDITYFGPTKEAARQGLFLLARAEVEGILEGRGGPEDERKPLAELLNGVENLPPFFQINPGPPPHCPGLK